MSEPQMNNAQRAMQCWSVLVMAARTRQVLSYEMMANMTGLPRWGMNKALGKVLKHCQQNRWPLLPSIVIEQSTGRPAAESEHYKVQPFDIEAEHRRVFMFDWFAHPPQLSHFEGTDEEG